MTWTEVVDGLFDRHNVAASGDFLRGQGQLENMTIEVVGTCNHAEIGVELALVQARAILDVIDSGQSRPILLLVDTSGQRLRHGDELLGLNRVMAHLAMTIDHARRTGHKVIGLVYDQALSGGFISTGLAADDCYALEGAEIRVMRIPAMARVTKLPEDFLVQLSQSNPVFAPGVENYFVMGGLRAIWTGDLSQQLSAALLAADNADRRSELGAFRGGRAMAAHVAESVLNAR